MDETSETESQGRDSKIDNDASAIPTIITDDYFEEVSTKCSEVCISFLTPTTAIKSNLSDFSNILHLNRARQFEYC